MSSLVVMGVSVTWRRATARPRWTSAVSHPLALSLGLVLGLRLSLGGLALVSLAVSPGRLADDWSWLRVTSPDWYAAIVAPWQHWDALWYQHIAASDYVAQSPDPAYLPLFPAAMRLVGTLIGGNLAVGGLLVSTASLMVALILLQRLVGADLGDDVARRSALYVALSPLAFILLAPYAEALFLALSVGCVLAARQRRWLIAGTCGALATLCRSAGAVLIVPLAVEVALEVRGRRRAAAPPLRPEHALVFAPALTLAAWMLWTHATLGVTGGPAAAGQGWGQHLAAPWTAIADSVRTILAWTHPEEIANLLAVVALIAAVPFMWRRLPASYAAYATASIPLLCFRSAWLTPLMSADRYLLVVFPFFVLIAGATQRRRVHTALLTTSAVTMAGLFVYVAAFDGFVG